VHVASVVVVVVWEGEEEEVEEEERRRRFSLEEIVLLSLYDEKKASDEVGVAGDFTGVISLVLVMVVVGGVVLLIDLGPGAPFSEKEAVLR